MTRSIMEIMSNFTFQRVMKPRTPASMEMMENVTHREHNGLGIKTKQTTNMATAATATS